jgi:NADPH2:quinone reductase
MRAVVRYKEVSRGVDLVDIPIPKLAPEHILVKITATPINPADELFINGQHGPVTTEPACCGMEGVGSVLELGPGVPKEFMNRKVVFFKHFKDTPEQVGTWAKYGLFHYQSCFIVDDSMKNEDVCGCLINPFTALAMLEVLAKKKQRAVIHTAAASGVGKVLLGLCLRDHIDLICVVRKKLHVDQLRALGAAYVFDQTDPNFDTDLAAACDKVQAHICFDAVGGDLTSRIIKAMPPRSSVYVYGALAGPIQNVDQGMLVWKVVKIRPFQMFKADFYGKYDRVKELFKQIFDDLRAGGKIFKTFVAKAYKLTEYKEALQKYKELAERGKSIFLPNAFP